MRWPKVRFKTWQIMAAVAVVAVALGWGLNRRSRFLALAAYHRAEGGDAVFYFEKNQISRLVITRKRDGQRVSEALYNWHSALAWKYREAARRPWLPVLPDPPKPE